MTITGQATNMGYRNQNPRSCMTLDAPQERCMTVTYLSPTSESSLAWLWHGEGPFKPMEVIIAQPTGPWGRGCKNRPGARVLKRQQVVTGDHSMQAAPGACKKVHPSQRAV